MHPPAPPPSSEQPLSGRLVLLFSTFSEPEGTIVRGLLAAQGIPVMVKGEAGGPYRAGSVDLWVPEELEPRARAILEDAQEAGSSSDDG